MQKVCRLFYGDKYEGNEGGINLTAPLDARDERVPKGVIIDDLLGTTGALDLDGDADKKLKYLVPDMSERNIAQFLSFRELALIAWHPDNARNGYKFSDEQKERYRQFVEALYKKQDAMAKKSYKPSIRD